MFGMTLEKVLVVLVLAAVIVGPHRLPAYAHRLAAVVRGVRSYTEALRGHVEREVGAPLAVEDWRSLDPRQYDPRRIVREALVAPAIPGAATESDATTVSDAGTMPDAGATAAPDALARERANRIAALSPGGWRPATASAAADEVPADQPA